MTTRSRWLALNSTACGLVLLVMQTPARAEEYRGTVDQQLACTPDVFRLCGSEIPDANRIVACLRQNTSQLGAPCRAVFEAQNSAPPAAPAPAAKDQIRTSRIAH